MNTSDEARVFREVTLRGVFVCATAVMFAGIGCRKATQQVENPVGSGGQIRPYTATMEPDDGQWVRATKDYANTRYSSLEQINTSNVQNLDPNPTPNAKGSACCDWVNRGAVSADGKVIYNTLDGYTVAVSADDGKLVWRTHLADINKGETITMAPTVVHNKVYVGNSGGEFGVRGWLAAGHGLGQAAVAGI